MSNRVFRWLLAAIHLVLAAALLIHAQGLESDVAWDKTPTSAATERVAEGSHGDTAVGLP